MSRWRRFALVLIVAMMVLLAAVPAVGAAPGGRPHDYLALGDSVAFGTNPLLDRRNVANFVGYPEVLAAMLGLNLANASCPGEASGGFISPTGTDNVCRPYRANFPLHVSYSTSQLDFAVAYLQRHPRTRLVTINIGANDLFVLQKECAAAADQTACVLNGLPGLQETLRANLATIYERILGEAKYRHDLAALTYYVTNYNDPTAVAVIGAINQVVTEVTLAYGGTVADGFGAFAAASAAAGGNACAAGLLIPLPGGGCDIHPSLEGQRVLAEAIALALGRPLVKKAA